MKPKYFHKFLGIRTGPPIVERLRGGIGEAIQLIKMKHFSFRMFNNETKLVQKFRHYIIATKETQVRNIN